MRPVEGMTLAELITSLREGGDSIRERWPTARLARLSVAARNRYMKQCLMYLTALLAVHFRG